MDTGEATHRTSTKFPHVLENQIPLLRELEKAKLIELQVGDTGDPEYDIFYKATELGKNAYHFLQNVVIDVLVRAKKQDTRNENVSMSGKGNDRKEGKKGKDKKGREK
ncbi:MAG: hypothetical protein DMF61_14790 [Blastocatellia bacterium AA13]|nr:MAG: hypothetical protein DMF61_14790 [Blastocatellia bacterium AA13]